MESKTTSSKDKTMNHLKIIYYLTYWGMLKISCRTHVPRGCFNIQWTSV